jgi:hypothetical protein
MILSKRYIRLNKVNIAILLFILSFTIVHIVKPSIVYNEDGSFRPFGLGFRHKTVVPIWVVAIILAIFCYLAVLYYLLFV